MADNKLIGTFDSTAEAMRKIEELKAQNPSEETDQYYLEEKNSKILLFKDQESRREKKGLNATAAYGDPTNNKADTVDAGAQGGPSVDESQQRDIEDNERHSALTAGDSAESTKPDSGTVDDVPAVGKSVEDMSAPNDNLNDVASTGRNSADVPMMDRQVDDVPPNDPNVGDATLNYPNPDDIPATSGRTDDVRIADPSVNDAATIDGTLTDIPANNPNMTDVPPADQNVNDVPTADRDLDRLSDTESPEEWPLSAEDRLRLRENEDPDDTEEIEEADSGRVREDDRF